MRNKQYLEMTVDLLQLIVDDWKKRYEQEVAAHQKTLELWAKWTEKSGWP